MTLGTTHSVLRYDGDGATTDFAVTFEFHDANDLEVIVVTRETGAEGQKSLGSDYSVSGGGGTTGAVSMTVAPAVAERLIIRRASSDQQPDDFRDGGALAAEPLERRLDIIAARLQELETDISRSLKVAKGSQATGLDLNLVGGKNRQLTVASDEQGVILATGTVPDTVQTSQFGEEWVNLNSELEARNLLMLGSAAVENTGTSGATVPLLNGANTHSGSNIFSADATFNSDLIVGAPFVLQSEVLTTDAEGQIVPTKSSILINNQGGASADNLDTIAVANHSVGSVIKVKAKTSSQVPTLRHAVGNIYLDENTNAVLDDRDKSIWLELRDMADGEHGAGWYEVGRSWRVFPAGAIVQTIIASTTTEFSITATIPHDTSVIQNTEGTEVLQATITPEFASSKLLITFNGTMTPTGTAVSAAGLFQDSIADALLASSLTLSNGSGFTSATTVRWLIDAVNMTARTYKVRCGPNAGTLFVNRYGTTANLFGANKLQTNLLIQEIAV